MIALHCDNPDCDAWQREPFESFLALRGQDSRDHHFCCTDCILKWAAQFDPKESIAL